jgi:hypothetical protein
MARSVHWLGLQPPPFSPEGLPPGPPSVLAGPVAGKEGLSMPRFIYLLGLGLALIGLALAVTDWVIGPAPGVSEANVRRIKPGMTVKDVEAILGRDWDWLAFHPPGNLCIRAGMPG